MNKSRLLSTAAVALMLSAGAAYAQAPSKDQAPAQPAPAAQQNAPAEKIAPPSQSVERKAGEIKAGETKADDAKANDAKPAAQAQQPNAPKTAADSGKADIKTPANAGKAEINGAGETGKAADSNKATTPAAERSTTGQGAASGAAKLSTEQRSKITTVIRQQKVQPVTLNVSISVGTRVPSSVRYYPLPVEVVTIYPEWRGYDYILVGDRIVILNPRTHEIVAIIEA